MTGYSVVMPLAARMVRHSLAIARDSRTLLLAETDLLRGAGAPVLQAPEMEREEHRLAQLGRHVGEFRLRELESRQRSVEDGTVECIADRGVHAVAGGAGRAEHDAEPGFGQAAQRCPQP